MTRMNIIIYGASVSGELAYKELKNDYNIIRFCDRNEKLAGTLLHDIEIITPDTISEYKDCVILIASAAYVEIAKYLISLGINRIMVFDKDSYQKACRNFCTKLRHYYIRPYIVREGKKESDCNFSYDNRKKAVEEALAQENGILAEQIIFELMQTVPYDVDLMAYRARLLFLQGIYEEAKSVVEKVLCIYPLHEYALQTKQMLADYFDNSNEWVDAYVKRALVNPAVLEKNLIEKRNNKKLRVLHSGWETGQMYAYSKGLNKIGVCSRTMPMLDNGMRLPHDYKMEIAYFDTEEEVCYQKIAELAQNFDVFHFHFGHTMLKNLRDVEVLQSLGKKVVMNFWGSEARLNSVAERNGYLIRESYEGRSEADNLRRLERLGSKIKDCIVMDAEMKEYVKDFFECVHIVPLAIDIDLVDFVGQVDNEKPLMVHSTSNWEIKGTYDIVKVIDELRKDYDFDFKLIEKTPYLEAMEYYKKADIIISQLIGPSYGVFPLEGMALGKPVINRIEESILPTYPSELPLVSADAQTLYGAIKRLLEDANLRRELGIQGRKYAENYHADTVIAKQLVRVYEMI